MNTIMPRGGRPNRHDHRDYDFFKTKKLGGLYPEFPENYTTEAGLWNPSQNEGSTLFTPKVPSMPYGCTDYTQTDLLIDEDKKLYNPMDLENITHANASGGIDVRTSMKAVVSIHKDHPAFFNIQPDIPNGGVLDWFDAVRVAMVLGKVENRAVSLGTPWFPEFMSAVEGIIREPNWALVVPGTSLSRVTWHNWGVKGWKTINGETYLIVKPWIGTRWGDNGFGYINRAVFNRLMSINGTVAYTLDKLLPGENPRNIDSTIAQWLVSLFIQLFHIT